MAKAKTQLFSEISGSFKQGVTFRKLPNKAKQIFQRKPIPSYTRTDKQDNVRTGYRRLCDIWKKAEWLDKTVYTNFAGIYKITPFNAWMKFNMPIISRKPVLFLGMDEGQGTTAHDYSTHKNNGEIVGATWQKLPTGKHIVKLDGVDDRIIIPFDESLNIDTQVTIAHWVRLDKQIEEFKGLLFSVGWNRYHTLLEADKRGFIGSVWVEGERQYLQSFVFPDIGKWYFVVYTYNAENGMARIYINGKLKNESRQATGTIDASTSDITVGSVGTIRYLPGVVALPRVLATELVKTEINKAYEIERHLFGV